MAIEKVTLTIDKTELFEAQMAAAKKGVNPDVVKNNSAFIRWLIRKYSKENLR